MTSCDYPPCRKSKAKTSFTYYFPTWLAARALMISGRANDLKRPGGSWTLKVPVVVPDGKIVWNAAWRGDIVRLQREFMSGLTPWIINENGRSLLHFAVKFGKLETISFLLGQGADPEIEDTDGLSPSATALRQSGVSSLEFEAFAQSPEDIYESLGFSSLHVALVSLAHGDHLSPALLETEYGHVNTRDRSGMTPLHWACSRGDVESIKLLASWKADVAMQDRRGWTCLHYACWSDDLDSVAAVLKEGCDPDACDRKGEPAMFMTNNPTIIDLLVQYGAHIDLKSSVTGRTALLETAFRGYSAVVSKLVSLGADIHALHVRGKNAVTLAIQGNNEEALSVLLSLVKQEEIPRLWPLSTRNSNALHITARYANVSIMRLLSSSGRLLTGLDPAAKDCDGDTPTDCFYKYREDEFTGVNEPFEVEQRAWWDLMSAVCEQNAIDFETFEPDWQEYFWDGQSSESGVETQSSEDGNDSVSEGSADASTGGEQEREEAEFVDAAESLHVS